MKFANTHYFFAGILVTVIVVVLMKKTSEGFQSQPPRAKMLAAFKSKSESNITKSLGEISALGNRISKEKVNNSTSFYNQMSRFTDAELFTLYKVLMSDLV
jgi:hypothetical protein